MVSNMLIQNNDYRELDSTGQQLTKRIAACRLVSSRADLCAMKDPDIAKLESYCEKQATIDKRSIGV